MKLPPFHITTAKLLLILLILFVIVLGLIFLFINQEPLPDDPKGEIKLAIIKGLLDIIVVAIIGGTVAAIFQAHERHREQSNIRVQKKIDFIERLGKFYRTTKSIRRKLRVHGLRAVMSDDTISLDKAKLDFCRQQMEAINDIQLELEGLKAEARIPLLFEKREYIEKQLGEMEKYLGKIHSEFEKENQSLETAASANLDTLEYLKEFTFSARETFVFKKQEKETDYRFKKHFSNPYRNVFQNLF